MDPPVPRVSRRFIFARKADGSWRFCQDYRQLNVLTKKSVDLLPHIDQLVDETRGLRFFTKLVLASVWHLPITSSASA